MKIPNGLIIANQEEDTRLTKKKKTLEECSSSSITFIEPQVSLLKQVEDQRSERTHTL
jgi:hypothetical protein